jgi:hypothetical protein
MLHNPQTGIAKLPVNFDEMSAPGDQEHTQLTLSSVLGSEIHGQRETDLPISHRIHGPLICSLGGWGGRMEEATIKCVYQSGVFI